jgi:hypothetical protein
VLGSLRGPLAGVGGPALPIDGWVAEEHAKLSLTGQVQVHVAHGAVELFVYGAVPDVRDLRRVLPDPLVSASRHVVTTDETVDDVLISRVAELDHDVAYDAGEPRVPCGASAHGDDGVRLGGADQRGDRLYRSC